MISMADIAFLLILFFLLTSSMTKETGVDVKLPRAQQADMLPKRDISIEVSKAGDIQLNKRAVSLAQLPAVLHAELGGTSSKKVTIRGDQDSPYGTMVQVMAAVRGEKAEILLAAEMEW